MLYDGILFYPIYYTFKINANTFVLFGLHWVFDLKVEINYF